VAKESKTTGVIRSKKMMTRHRFFFQPHGFSYVLTFEYTFRRMRLNPPGWAYIKNNFFKGAYHGKEQGFFDGFCGCHEVKKAVRKDRQFNLQYWGIE